MDNVLVDFESGIEKLPKDIREKFRDNLDEVPHFFGTLEPMHGAVESFKKLAKLFDVYILSTAPWGNPTAWTDKHEWVKAYLGKEAEKRLILTHHKHLNKGDFLIDDRHNKNGADKFTGELLHFGPGNAFPGWKEVVEYLEKKI
jgi:5'(3')-deoxyribonucleotidase